MRKMKSLVLAVMGLLCCMSVSAYDFYVEGIYYNITSKSNKTVEVTYREYPNSSYSNGYSGVVTIPESVGYRGVTYSVTSIGMSAFGDCSDLVGVTIPSSVITIKESAFRGCSSLTGFAIPKGVTTIELGAFSGCSSLKSITIPNNVISIAHLVFQDCSSLTEIKVANDNPKYDSRENCNAIIETQTNTLIAGCSQTYIPNSVTMIGKHAFQKCSNLTKITIPNSVTAIGNSAFSGCSSLTEITIPNSVITIGNSAFSNCHALMRIAIPDAVTTIGEGAFLYCINLKEFTIPNSVKELGQSFFEGCASLKEIIIPNSVKLIGSNAFKTCDHLTEITIPNSVTSIGKGAFFDCLSLTTAVVGCSWKFNPLYSFANKVTVSATLHSYENGICTVCGEQETTGINNTMTGNHLPATIYDLQGRCVNNPSRGLYIVNGKKVLVK